MSAAPTILITNGGPHPPELWAETTVAQIIAVAPTAGASASKFRDHLLEILTLAHYDIQREYATVDPVTRAVDVAIQITDASADYSFRDHFVRHETLVYLQQLLSEHFSTVIDIERQWAADRTARKGT